LASEVDARAAADPSRPPARGFAGEAEASSAALLARVTGIEPSFFVPRRWWKRRSPAPPKTSARASVTAQRRSGHERRKTEDVAAERGTGNPPSGGAGVFVAFPG
jgi:hypothetical protein